MRKLAWILIFVMMFSGAQAEGFDFSSMTDAELQAVVESASAELARRAPAQENSDVLIDQDGVKVTLTGNHEVWGYDNWYLDLEVVVENYSDAVVSILPDTVSINGWNVFCTGVSDTQPGKKQKGMLEFSLSEAEISTFEEVEEIEMTFTLYDSEKWETISTTEPVVLNY